MDDKILRLGVYGGTFSPPHAAHERCAKEFVDKFSLDKLLIIPAFIPPHKAEQSRISVINRLNMCKLAFSGIAHAEVSSIEIERGGLSYTSDTLKELKTIYPNSKIYLLVGTDMFTTLDKWHEPSDIFNLATVVCVRRDNNALNNNLILEKNHKYQKDFNAETAFLDIPAKELSSSYIRENINKSLNDESLLSDKVSNYIKEKGLYQ